MMTKLMWKSAALAALTSLATLTAQAEQKIGTVSLAKVFDGYYKTKQANEKVQDTRSSFEKSGKTLQEDYTKANEIGRAHV